MYIWNSLMHIFAWLCNICIQKLVSKHVLKHARIFFCSMYILVILTRQSFLSPLWIEWNSVYFGWVYIREHSMTGCLTYFVKYSRIMPRHVQLFTFETKNYYRLEKIKIFCRKTIFFFLADFQVWIFYRCICITFDLPWCFCFVLLFRYCFVSTTVLIHNFLRLVLQKIETRFVYLNLVFCFQEQLFLFLLEKM